MRGTAAVAIRRTWVSDKACRGASTTAPAKPDGHSGAGLAACRERPDAVVLASLPTLSLFSNHIFIDWRKEE